MTPSEQMDKMLASMEKRIALEKDYHIVGRYVALYILKLQIRVKNGE